MKYIILLLIFSVFHFSSFAQGISTLEDIRHFSKKERAKIKSRYKYDRDNDQLFSKDEFLIIEQKQLAPIISELILHEKIKINNADALVSFASQIKASNLDYKALESRIIRYINDGDIIFLALRKAIEREHFHQWKIKRNHQATNDRAFVKTVDALNLNDDERTKVINAWAVCVDSFRDEESRNGIMKPYICEPIDDYKKPVHEHKTTSVCEDLSHEEMPQRLAYKKLVDEAAIVAFEESLTTFEKIKMAKCIAEQSLRFFIPAHHPFKALHKTLKISKRSPDRAFFMTTGVCGNFSAMAYNIAKNLDLTDQVFLAKKGVHVYLEFKDQKNWYHAHPFNSKSRCDITKFPIAK